MDWPATPGKDSQDGAAPGTAGNGRLYRLPSIYLLLVQSLAVCSRCCASLAAWPRESSAHPHQQRADARIRQVPVARNAGQITRADPTPTKYFVTCTTAYYLATADWTVCWSLLLHLAQHSGHRNLPHRLAKPCTWSIQSALRSSSASTLSPFLDTGAVLGNSEVTLGHL